MIDWAHQSRTLLRGGLIYGPNYPSALLIDGDTIAWVGDDTAAEAYRDIADEVIDLHGRFVTPGFVDAHVHATSTGLTLATVDLSAATCATDILDLVASAAKSGRGRPILGHGWDESTWPDQLLPTRSELDRASWGSAVFLSRIDVHAALISSAVLAAAPAIRDASGFTDDGPITERALVLAREALIGSLPASSRREAQQRFRAAAAAHGIVAVHEMANPVFSSATDLTALLELAAAEPGPLVTGYWGVLAQDGGIGQARELGAWGVGGDLLADGSLGSHTACLREPYADAPSSSGRAFLDPEAIAEHLVASTEAAMQAGFHVIGDQAAEHVLRGFQIAAQRVGMEQIRHMQHRLEHLVLTSTEQVEALAPFGVIASMQPMFEATWGGPSGMYEQRLGAERCAHANPTASIQDAGIPVAFGSDAPVTPLGPWAAVQAAMDHHNPQQRLSGRAAFSAHTRGGWRAIGRSGGVLEPGMPAHVVIWDTASVTPPVADGRIARWSTDPRSGVPGLPDLSAGLPICVRTIIAGRTSYTAEAP
jgi:predicted amidohydrolase YtcJ